jgi:predicted glycoside hydrolase/deacetylase ChbG (UPF0249 family)
VSDDADRPPLRRRLIVNADDFGQSPGVNDGVARAHQQGIVTSASLMVRWPAAKAAAAYARQYPDLSLGLHVDLGEWEHRGESWVPMYAVVDTEDVPAVEQELRRQLETFRDLTGRDPTHLDSHQHVHRTATLLPVFRALALKTEAFLREEPHGIRYDGHFYGWDGYGGWVPGATDVGALVGIIESLGPGVTELGCHPGLGADMSSSYREERSVETATLCDPRVVDAIIANGVELVSFHDVRGRPRPLRPDRAPEQQLV